MIMKIIICIYTVCIRFLNNFTKRMKDSGIDSSSPDRVEIEFLKACKEAKGKDERFVSTRNDWFDVNDV